ncbi:hypothetical protein G6F57_018286 [Rhizopus arrhizus]|nr:hypothetical protein G6F57_018286 [Rhizopus arrhizus]
MVELCHAAEEALGIARAGQAVLQAHHFDAAQQSLDYLQSMLDAVSSGTEPGYAPPELIAQFDMHGGGTVAPTASAPAAGGGDLITADEFEALLDQLHGGNAPTAVTPAKKADDGLISEDEFEALLDQLHGGAAPGSKAVAAAPVAPPPAPRPAAPTPPAKPAAKPLAEAEHTVRVDTKRLDAIVNLIGELVLSRNRLKTLRARLRDEELDRAVSTLDIATARLQSAVMRTRMKPVGKVRKWTWS